ncbi:MAG: hypothetical protein AB1422_10425 [bacterium]
MEPLDIEVNLAQQAEVGRMQQAGIYQINAWQEQIAGKLELEAETSQTSVQTTQLSEEEQIEKRKGDRNKNPYWWKKQYQYKQINNIHLEEIQPIPHPIKGRFIDVFR